MKLDLQAEAASNLEEVQRGHAREVQNLKDKAQNLKDEAQNLKNEAQDLKKEVAELHAQVMEAEARLVSEQSRADLALERKREGGRGGGGGETALNLEEVRAGHAGEAAELRTSCEQSEAAELHAQVMDLVELRTNLKNEAQDLNKEVAKLYARVADAEEQLVCETGRVDGAGKELAEMASHLEGLARDRAELHAQVMEAEEAHVRDLYNLAELRTKVLDAEEELASEKIRAADVGPKS